MLSVVATRYAGALVDVIMAGATAAPGSKITPEQALAQLKNVQDVIWGSADLKGALESPAVAPSKKRAVMAKLLAPMNVDTRIRNFVFVIIDHRRVHEFASIIQAFETLANERLGLVQADVVSARSLDAGRKARMEAELSRIAGKKAKVSFSEDPSLLGGVIARVGSTVYDGSVRGQLERLRTKLART
jgi:F-type H+-transporting ATPase subunit delta